MKLELITLSVPLFFAGIIIELLLNRMWKRDYYVLGDSLGSLGTGVLDQLCISITRVALFTFPYVWLYEHASLARFEEPTVAVIAGGLLLADFGYYWGHRFTHEINFLWAGHVVHHSSEQYNLTTALRQNWFGSWFLYLFNLPLAVAGVAPKVAMIIIPFIQIYQYWIHTRLIPKLGPFELVFNTPSHHRVHHGINPEYVDKNYGAILIVWDKLFGTFEEERAEVVYGVLKPLNSWNPVKAWLAPWGDLFRARSLWCWWKPPGWDPSTRKLPDLVALFGVASKQRYLPRLTRPAKLAALFSFVAILGAASVYLFLVPQLTTAQSVTAALALITLLAGWGAWLERKTLASEAQGAVRVQTLA